jgi:hypothetical protein
MPRKGQMFVITMVFLVGLVFSVQSLLFSYSQTDLSSGKSQDAYTIKNMEEVLQSALDSSPDCREARDNVDMLENMVSRTMGSGSQVRFNGGINCTATGDWTSPPELVVDVMISGSPGETWTTLSLTRSP